MPECGHCGRHVSTDFARVFGDNENEVEGCLACGYRHANGRGANPSGQRARDERGDGQTVMLDGGGGITIADGGRGPRATSAGRPREVSGREQ